MKNKLAFQTDDQGRKYCLSIVETMVRLFSISEQEAIGRMNRLWHGQSILGPDDVVYHEDEEYWAKVIYYGKDFDWSLGFDSVEPLPYP